VTLAPHETERFYRIWWRLLSYVNAHLGVVSKLPSDPADGSIDAGDALKVREALWRDDPLREQFVTENPAGLSPDDLALVRSWSHRVAGRFYVYRHLRKRTVVLTASGEPRAYGVLGLVSPLMEVLWQPPPVLVDMVLLPFEDRITYDGLISPYRITFGTGVRSSLDETYRQARERGGVITTLLPTVAGGDEASQSRLRAGNALVLKEFRKELAADGLSGRKVEEHVGNAEAVADELLRGHDPRSLLDVRPEDLRAALAFQGPGSRVSLRRLARFLERSGRVEWGSLGEFLKLR
jgi:hypothetical protein